MKHILFFIGIFISFSTFSQIDCTAYAGWPAVGTNLAPNQNSWCEWCLDYANNGFQNFNPLGLGWADPTVSCDCCDPTLWTQSWNCLPHPADPGNFLCVDPGDGTGTYSTLSDCQDVCLPSWNCVTFWDPTGIPTGMSCIDPGDGTGTYSALSDCEAVCSCDLYNSWPVSDPSGGPNQNSWCEWCADYTNPNSFYYPNFNPIGLGWGGNPDTMCSCCWALDVEENLKNKKVLKFIDLLGRDYGNNTFRIEIYDDGTVEKKYIINLN